MSGFKFYGQRFICVWMLRSYRNARTTKHTSTNKLHLETTLKSVPTSQAGVECRPQRNYAFLHTSHVGNLPFPLHPERPPPPPSSHDRVAAHLATQLARGGAATPSRSRQRSVGRGRSAGVAQRSRPGLPEGLPVLELADVAVEPQALELLGRHVLGAGDLAAAGGRATEAVERLRHVPFRGGVEELYIFQRQRRPAVSWPVRLRGKGVRVTQTVSSSPGFRPWGPARTVMWAVSMICKDGRSRSINPRSTTRQRSSQRYPSEPWSYYPPSPTRLLKTGRALPLPRLLSKGRRLTREGSQEWLRYSRSLLRLMCLFDPTWTVA